MVINPTNAQSSSPSPHQNQQQPSLYEYLYELISKRVATITYLRRAHGGNTYWFNTILLTKDDLDNLYPNAKMIRRTCNFYMLGVSLGTILEITNTWDYLKALHQLLNEFECYTNDHSKQKMKNIFRKARNKDENAGSESNDFTHLLLPHVPFELDYLETFYSFSDIIVEAYQKLLSGMDSSSCTQSYFELVLKCDAKVKKIMSVVTKELDTIARNAIKEELKLIDPLSHSNKVSPIDFEGAEA
ncbi:uncharacterized protein BYT42DRAFT_121021 [Radiomyces spectabilis]|uniref:uncharacterized protein n=1 Tax=Radiomyces spectabilis TaxID=64574 RepID=UPI00222066F5|nr:uncharacterized protein BYT42DRAFT_121021 [Radiomyces spectabilis]KAI8368184.1 hypothetical protein BYT42DRAFT_121021 [Radiomyces spectabilis]